MEIESTTPTLPPDIYAQYEKAFAALNPRQRQAVESIGSPTLVIAGPGTGKTQLLAMRVAYQLVNTDTRPSEILCLTFTEAGAVAMRQRLLQIIGPAAHKVGVYTFHGFCNEVIQTHLPELDLPEGMMPINELEHIKLIRKLIETLQPGNPLRRIRGDLYYEQTRLIKFFETLKFENWNPDQLAEEIEEFIKAMPHSPDFQYKRKQGNNQKGDPKWDTIKKLEKQLRPTQAACRLFPEYEEAMRKSRRYAFADMINWVLAAFESNFELLAEYRERFQYVLVDEYQDTNGAQNALLHYLIEDPDGRPNVFVVCDDDQAIYRFQGARPDNIAKLFQQYQQAFEVVCLTDNYRSTQEILDVAGTLIAFNFESRLVNDPTLKRYFPTLDKTLVARAPHAQRQGNPPPSVAAYPTPNDESIGILSQIEDLMGPQWREGIFKVKPNEIAVLYAKHAQAEEVVRVAGLRGIPVYLKRKQDVLSEPLIRSWLNLLRYIHEESTWPGRGDHRIFELLNLSCWGLLPRTVHYLGALYSLARLNALNQREADQEVIMPSFGILLRQCAIDEALNPVEREKLAHAANSLQEWVAQVPNLGLVVLMQTVLEQSGILKQVSESPDRIALLKQLRKFFSFVEEEARRAGTPATTEGETARYLDLGGLLRVLKEMQELGIPLEHDVAIGLPTGVQFITAHSSKGLEYQHVFMMHTTEDGWSDKKRGNNQQYKLPPPYIRSADEQDYDDKRRLFYVALTRAKQSLVVSYPLHNETGTSILRAPQLDEIATAHPHFKVRDPEGEALRNTAPEDQAADYLANTMRPSRQHIDMPETLRDLLTQYRLSPSGLNLWLECQRKFYYEELLRLPRLIDPSLTVGSVVHDALCHLFRRTNQTGEWFGLSDLQLEFLRRLEERKGLLTNFQFDSFRLWADDFLPGYYRTFRPKWVMNTRNEYKFRSSALGNVPVTGRIDKIEVLADGLRLVDYKTGKPDGQFSKTDGPSERNPTGADYWRQAIFYALLAEMDPNLDSLPVKEAVFEYVVPTEEGEWIRKDVGLFPEAKAEVMRQLTDAWTGIQALSLDAVLQETRREHGMCGKCEWCKPIVRNHSGESDIESD